MIDELVQSKSKDTYGFWLALVLSAPGPSNILPLPLVPLFLLAHFIVPLAPFFIPSLGLNLLEIPLRSTSQSKHKLSSFNSFG
jgi:hypothetical protein